MSLSIALAACAACAAVLCGWEVLHAVSWPWVGRWSGRAVAAIGQGASGSTAAEGPDTVRGCAVGAAAAGLGGWLLAGPIGALAGGALAPASVLGAARVRGERRRRRAVAETPRVARALADALDAGHSIRGAFASVVGDGVLDGAAAAALARVGDALALGQQTDVAIASWARELADPGVDSVAAALLLGGEHGGDLGLMLRDVARSGEQAARARHEALSTLTQARATARLVMCLPAAGLALAELVAPGYLVALVTDPIPALLVAAAVALQFIAAVAVRRLAQVPA